MILRVFRRRFPLGFLLLLLLLLPAVKAIGCRRETPGVEPGMNSTPAVYTPFAARPTLTVRPGEPTPLPELPE